MISQGAMGEDWMGRGLYGFYLNCFCIATVFRGTISWHTVFFLHEWESNIFFFFLEQHASCVSHRRSVLIFLDIYSLEIPHPKP